MGIWEIWDAVWELPWYKAMAIAVLDDIIVLFKIWPAYILFFVAGLIYAYWYPIKDWFKKWKTK